MRPSPARLLRLMAAAIAFAALSLCAGCESGPDASYGFSRGDSLNGTRAFAALLRGQGHVVRASRRLTADLAAWAQVIVRFAPRPGPPDRDEARWYEDWLELQPDRSLVYVVRDYDAEPEYWAQVIDQLAGPSEKDRLAEARLRRDRAGRWIYRLPSQDETPADPDSWFATGPGVEPPAICKTLSGRWATSIDAGPAAIPMHQPLLIEPGTATPLLIGDDRVLAMEWQIDEGGGVLVLANASFLLNLPLVNPARRPLAEQVADWIADRPCRIAFVEGASALAPPRGPRSLFELVSEIPSFRWVAIHMGLFALLASLARAPGLGRPRPEPPSEAGRPAAHAEALGTLLERSRGDSAARDALAAYRRWRFGRGGSRGGGQWLVARDSWIVGE